MTETKKRRKRTVAPAPDVPAIRPPDPFTASDEEIRLWMARENLAKYGTTTAPTAPTTMAVTRIVGRKASRVIDPKWFTVRKVCPHCKKEKNVGQDFGVVVRRGIESAAGWCRQCRSGSDYRSKPRKNRTRNSTP